MTYTTVNNLKTFSGFDGQAGEIDVTNCASTAKEFRLGLTDPGHFQIELDQDLGDAGQLAMRAAQVSGCKIPNSHQILFYQVRAKLQSFSQDLLQTAKMIYPLHFCVRVVQYL